MALLGERLAEGRLCSADPARANSIRKLAAEVGMPVPAPDPTHGFAAPEPTASPYAGDDWDFGDLQRTTQATHGDCLAPGIALYRHDSLLSEEECLYIQCLGGPDLGPSISVDSQGRRHQNDVRTSWDFIFLPEFEQLYLNLLQRRMADAAGLPVNQAEPLILLRYLPGQEYKLHRDFLPTSLFIPVTAGGSGQRLRTAVSYLNTPPAGGETAFPLLNTDIPAIRGQMVRFDNLLPDGQITRTSLHAGLPVKQGVKWICTLWFRERAHRLQ
jgi:prolyl 4-hydroxylase